MVRQLLLASALAVMASGTTSSSVPVGQQPSADAALRGHVSWVIQSMKRMEGIKPGMTRADLLKVFTPEGGLQTGRNFAYRDCLYFHVVVEFEPTPQSMARDLSMTETRVQVEGLPGDVIKTISKPTIYGMVID